MICYIMLTISVISNRNNVVSPSEMYHDLFQKENNYGFWETIDIKGRADKFHMHTYILNVNFIYAF